MRNPLTVLKSFIAKYDFADALVGVADDLKKAAAALFLLWLFSQVPHLPLVFSALPKVLGVDVVVSPPSGWVSWMLIISAFVLYIVQFILRVKARKGSDDNSAGANKGNSVVKKGNKNGSPRRTIDRRCDCGCRLHDNQNRTQTCGNKKAAR